LSRTRIWFYRFGLISTLVFASSFLGPLTAQSASSAVSWRGDYETGDFSQWGIGTVQALPGDATIVSAPVRDGKYAARFLVPASATQNQWPGTRSEVYTSTGEQAGTESWWGWSTYFPKDFAPAPNSIWNIFTQWHNTGPTGQANAHFEIDTTTTPWHLELRTFGGQENQNEHRFYLADFQPETWYDFIFHVRWAADSTGFVEVWVNGKLVVPLTNIPTIYQGEGVYLKQGFYRAPANVTSVVYQDAMRRGDSYSDLAGAAPSPPSASPAPLAPPPPVTFAAPPQILPHKQIVVRAKTSAMQRLAMIVRDRQGHLLGVTYARANRYGYARAKVSALRWRNQRHLRVVLWVHSRHTARLVRRVITISWRELRLAHSR
jgi:hypothetical protein